MKKKNDDISEYPDCSEIHSGVLFIIMYLSDEKTPQMYKDDKISMYKESGGYGSQNTKVILKFPDGKEVLVFDYLGYDKNCRKYNKGFWIDYLKKLSSKAEVIKIEKNEIKERQAIERHNKLFGKVDDSLLFL